MEVEDRGLVLLDDTTGYAGFDTWFDDDDDDDDAVDERVVCYIVGNAGPDT